MIEKIEDFISKVKEKYPDLVIGYEYDSNNNEYCLWHNDFKLQFYNKEFLKHAGKLIREIFYKNNHYDISFGYDHLKANEVIK